MESRFCNDFATSSLHIEYIEKRELKIELPNYSENMERSIPTVHNRFPSSRHPAPVFRCIPYPTPVFSQIPIPLISQSCIPPARNPLSRIPPVKEGRSRHPATSIVHPLFRHGKVEMVSSFPQRKYSAKIHLQIFLRMRLHRIARFCQVCGATSTGEEISFPFKFSSPLEVALAD